MTADVERALRASNLFKSFDDRMLAAVAKTAVRRSFARGELVWRAGDVPTCFTVIVVGLVKIARRRADGTEAIVAIFGPRESIGDVAVTSQRPYPADAIAASEVVEVVQVDAGPVLSTMASRPDVADAINRSLILHTRALQEKIAIMTAGSVPQRLASLLLHLAERFGDEMEDGSTRVPVALSRADLAHLVGATVETTIRAMSKWQKEGIVHTSEDGGFQIDRIEELRRVVAGE